MRERPGALRPSATRLLAILVAATAGLATATPALGADSIYWGNQVANKISFAALDASGGGDIATTGATVNNPVGTAIDSAAGRIYWANTSGNKISYANMDGTGGGGDLVTTGVIVGNPAGVAIDPGAGRIYWANGGSNKISYANLNGTGGGNLTTTGATVSSPDGVAIDPGAGRIYWANAGVNKISYANLDGTGGGGDLVTTGATVSLPIGVAIDSAAGRIYWANDIGGAISYANLNGTGGGDLVTTGATTSGPSGVAIDPDAGRIYWANVAGSKISYANLNGTGGGDLVTTGATVTSAGFPVLLKTPAGTGPPTVTGGSSEGSTLSCSQGSWAADLLGSFLYRFPHTFAYKWSRDGIDLAEETAPTIAANTTGQYRCRVTAQNQAGSSSQTSELHAVVDTSAPKTTITKKPKSKIKTKKKSVKVEVSFSSEAGATFSCKLDKAAFKPCTSPYAVKAQSKGGKGKKHTISVKAKDGTGNVGKPAVVKFKVIRKG